jgi:hypothetical protein
MPKKAKRPAKRSSSASIVPSGYKWGMILPAGPKPKHKSQNKKGGTQTHTALL